MNRLSAQIAAVAVTATAIGLLDAALVTIGLAGARGSFQFVPPRIWIIAPAVWVLLAGIAIAVVLPLMRRWGGAVVAAALTIVFLTIRLRDHVVLLFAVIAAWLVVLVVSRRWIPGWMTRL